MSVKQIKGTEWGTTKRTVYGGLRKFVAVVYWKRKDGRWVEIADHLKVPAEIKRIGEAR